MSPILLFWFSLGVVLTLTAIRYVVGIPLSTLFKVAEHERRRLHNEKLRKEKRKKE